MAPLKRVSVFLADPSLGQLLSTENGDKKLLLGSLQVSTVVMFLPLGNAFLGPLCERDCVKHQHSVALPGVKWGPLAACRLKKEIKWSAVFSCAWTNLCSCLTQSSLKIIFLYFMEGEGRVFRPIDFWVQNMYCRFEGSPLINCVFNTVCVYYSYLVVQDCLVIARDEGVLTWKDYLGSSPELL